MSEMVADASAILPVLTADRAWAIAGLDIDVRLIR